MRDPQMVAVYPLFSLVPAEKSINVHQRRRQRLETTLRELEGGLGSWWFLRDPCSSKWLSGSWLSGWPSWVHAVWVKWLVGWLSGKKNWWVGGLKQFWWRFITNCFLTNLQIHQGTPSNTQLCISRYQQLIFGSMIWSGSMLKLPRISTESTIW